jgi:hypothetical protein
VQTKFKLEAASTYEELFLGQDPDALRDGGHQLLRRGQLSDDEVRSIFVEARLLSDESDVAAGLKLAQTNVKKYDKALEE